MSRNKVVIVGNSWELQSLLSKGIGFEGDGTFIQIGLILTRNDVKLSFWNINDDSTGSALLYSQARVALLVYDANDIDCLGRLEKVHCAVKNAEGTSYRQYVVVGARKNSAQSITVTEGSVRTQLKDLSANTSFLTCALDRPDEIEAVIGAVLRAAQSANGVESARQAQAAAAIALAEPVVPPNTTLRHVYEYYIRCGGWRVTAASRFYRGSPALFSVQFKTAQQILDMLKDRKDSNYRHGASAQTLEEYGQWLEEQARAEAAALERRAGPASASVGGPGSART